MENVPLAAASNQFELFLGIVEGAGYETAAAVLNAAEYGNAQTRQRLVMVGRRGRGSRLEVSLPSPTHAPIGRYFDYAPGAVRDAQQRDDALLGTMSSTRRAARVLLARFRCDVSVMLPTPKVYDVIERLPVIGTSGADALSHVAYGHSEATLAQMATCLAGGQRETNRRYHGAAYAACTARGSPRP